ncbi:MAG: hypothetical protein IT236_08840, partial [Bacteroidia bacterium]|nr:hypothetical protein [Bacteroidia bacterium]
MEKLIARCLVFIAFTLVVKTSNAQPTFEIRRVVNNIEPGKIVGYSGKSGLNEDIVDGKSNKAYTK